MSTRPSAANLLLLVFAIVCVVSVIISNEHNLQPEHDIEVTRRVTILGLVGGLAAADTDSASNRRCCDNLQQQDNDRKVDEPGSRRRRRSLKKGRRSSPKSALQPRVDIVESHPVHMGFNSISNLNGTPWCGGRPTFWITGHQRADTPSCLVNETSWVVNETLSMDSGDEMNGWDGIDRHACVTMDVNQDGVEDIICSVGANQGHGTGYNELYITQANGTLSKIQKYHGLQAYPYMRNRYTTVLKNDRGVKHFVFFATTGGKRDDGRSNLHRMFQNVYENEGSFPYFQEVHGPWQQDFEASCAVAGDFTRDQRDDLVVCNQNGPPLLVQQGNNNNNNNNNNTSNFWWKVVIPNIHNKKYYSYLHNWRNVRLSDVTGDGLVDLIVVTWGQPSQLYIFRGKVGNPFFDFRRVYFEAKLPYGAPDLEILDVNQDRAPDIYVIQVDETKHKYCGGGNANVFWGGARFPPITFTPPRDKANDLLFLGGGHNSKNRMKKKQFTRVKLRHSLPGCGFIAQRWDDKTMVLGNGNWDSAGYGLLLRW